MVVTYLSGAHVNCYYAFENPENYNRTIANHVASDEIYREFGQGIDTSFNRISEIELAYGQGRKNFTSSYSKKYVGNFTINGIMTNPFWLFGILGNIAKTSVSGFKLYTFTETGDADGTPIFTIKNAFNQQTATVYDLLGCKLASLNLNISVNEAVKFTLEGIYRIDKKSANATIDKSANIGTIFTFAGGILTFPTPRTGTIENTVGIQSVEINISNELSENYELNNRFMTSAVDKMRKYEIKIKSLYKDDTNLTDRFYGQAGSPLNIGIGKTPALKLLFTNQIDETVELNFTNINFGSDDMSFNIEDMVDENISIMAGTCSSIVYKSKEDIIIREADN